MYHLLSEAEDGWNFIREQLDLVHEEVDTHTHVHLENAIEMHDAELEERAETIANLEQQLLSCRSRHHPHPRTPTRSVSCRASMRNRSQ
jgi:hypothetical protein